MERRPGARPRHRGTAARTRGRRRGSPFSRALPVLLLVVIAFAPPPLGAQGEAERGKGAVLRGGGGVGVLDGGSVPVLRGSALLRWSPRVRIGAEGVHIPAGVRLSATASPDQTELAFGYGGIRGEWAPGEASRWAFGVLLAAGTARVRAPLQGSDLATRNLLLVEPGVTRTLWRPGPFQAGLEATARLPLVSPVLPGVAPGALRGGALSFYLEWIREP